MKGLPKLNILVNQAAYYCMETYILLCVKPTAMGMLLYNMRAKPGAL